MTERSGPLLHVVTPGEPIAVEAGFLRGHGTHLAENQQTLIASVAGVVERVNKLVCARAVTSRYQPEVGDVVVGRISEVGQGRWKVDVNSRADATLMLSAVNLPGGVQRRRTQADELNMRAYLQESDLISSEVQSLNGDGTAALHTRSAKYGRLVQGTFVAVPAGLVRRCKSHFHMCDFGVSFLFGCNGWIWVYPTTADAVPAGEEEMAASLPPPSNEVRQRMARLRNCFLCLAAHGVAIYPDTVLAAYRAAETADVPLKEMLRPAISEAIAAKAREVSQI